MAFLTFITFVLTVFPLTLIFPRTRFIRASASIIFTIVLLLLLLDAFIYNRLGYHINGSSFSQIFDLINEEINRDRRTFWFVSIILCLLILSFELVVSNYAWKHLKALQKTVFARFVVFGLVICFFISHIMHIWADANLEYDVLKQDTVLPVSYPFTAKTLLTKYGLFDREDYLERRTSPLSFKDPIPPYPSIGGQCAVNEQRSTFLILTKQRLKEHQIDQFIGRANAKTIKLKHHIDNALTDQSWFNLFYGLPSIYETAIIEQNKAPLIFQALSNTKLNSSFTTISKFGHEFSNPWLIPLFDKTVSLDNISSLILSNNFNKYPAGLHVIYFDDDDEYQFELFMDALLFAQRSKAEKDIIWVSSVGNSKAIDGLSRKPALLILPGTQRENLNRLTSHMDLPQTLLEEWLNCPSTLNQFASGENLEKLDKDRVIANTIAQGMMVFRKDKSVFIDHNGNFQSYSGLLNAPITESSDFPLMIDGVHFIKQFSQLSKPAQ